MTTLTTIGLYMALSGAFGVSTPALPFNLPLENSEFTITAEIPLNDKKKELKKVIDVEAYVRNYFSDIPILADVARCESEFRHTDKKGNILRGRVDSRDVGVMQINTFYHGTKAKKLGFDIFTIDGNLGYARYVYEKEGRGLLPWMASSPCWSKVLALAKPAQPVHQTSI